MDTTYELLDAGDGARLERFGAVATVRPAPAARASRLAPPDAWTAADAVYHPGDRGKGGAWEARGTLPDPWAVRSAGLRMRLRLAPSGQVGLFPEQEALRERIGALLHAQAAALGEPPRVLNLFAYTGGTTLAAAAAGARVAHVDAARGVVSWARENAALNALDSAPIRWIADDARRFVTREARRGRRYDAVLLDPPTFGRGTKGESWKIERDLPGLLEACASLLSGPQSLLLLTAHTTGWRAGRLSRSLRDAFSRLPIRVESGTMELAAVSGARLPAGCWAIARPGG
ncbi:MAG: class I SAM-dependent methyltransferase [Gemmatimonadota bacterium]|jgi:23S rRNA (cytosine1962-C5)-methyltransferase|nr:SAM-dependent methyltransferase [Gemmatimonadota bacterium]MDP6462032.1 class I SAM-dependent methyltransferase [Gemmatimonadota bacterium]MDP6529165.1 class I SAM-dependent methyltransferase [Gemmatimonadota bacterium]MDP6802854.1 class I SAM-dependent methyltransferase [Gemmatimonadota bacterium]MDP7032200.1 class I SAM-dependent methyltransferase [Gemmatimonadota bacterium]